MVTLKEMIEEYEGVQRQIEARRARVAPDAQKLTKVMTAPRTYSFWYTGADGRGRAVKFCVAHHVNVARYVLTWRQVEWTSTQGRFSKWHCERYDWAAFKTRAGALSTAKKRYEKWCAKHGVKVMETDFTT